MSGTAASKLNDAADELLVWLANQPKPQRDTAPSAALGNERNTAGGEERATASVADPNRSFPIQPDSLVGPSPVAEAIEFGGTMRLVATDWLFHRLTVRGAADDVSRFRRAARGSGMIPWLLDLDRMEEGYFHLLVAPDQRSLSVAGARIFARQLRDAVGRRHDLAVSQIDQSLACLFDLHALVPVPHHILALGPDEPQARAWLWAHWGTTEALRHAAEVDSRASGAEKMEDGENGFQLSFWSADWTPWRALHDVGARWPSLQFDIRPAYDLP